MGDAMQEAEALELAADAINAGIFNDLGSGGCPNVRIIRKNGTTDFLEEISQAEQGGRSSADSTVTRRRWIFLVGRCVGEKERCEGRGDFGRGDSGGSFVVLFVGRKRWNWSWGWTH